ncbi:unnamed protein product [Caretta caretta]
MDICQQNERDSSWEKLSFVLRLSCVEKGSCISGGWVRMGENWKRNPGPRHSPKVLCIQVPPSAQDTYLLKDLKRGQKCYLYSIMRVYDSKPLREMLSHQYMLNLQRQNLLGHITEHEVRFYTSFLDQAEERGPRKVSARNSTSLKSSVGRTQLGLTACSS